MHSSRPSFKPGVASAPPVKHYENFPVASYLCPAHLRPAIAAIYHFARSADDLADEGQVDAATRLANLQAYRADLLALTQGQSSSSGRWDDVLLPLQRVINVHQLPLQQLTNLLDAFEQDVRYTEARYRYADDCELLNYCQRSANPIGRLLLHLYGVHDEAAKRHSDHICSALQLINFWQDVSVDVPRQRWYITRQAMQQHGVTEADFLPNSQSAASARLIAANVQNARAMLHQGAALPFKIGGRAGWELRLVLQGGWRILDKIEAIGYKTWQTRPKLKPWDVPLLLWRAALMRQH